MANNSQFLGWTIEFQDETNDIKYDTEIVDLAIGQDNNSSIVMCTIKYSVDSTFMKYFLKKHEGTLTLINKMIYTEDTNEIFTIKLESVTNVGSILEREEDVSRSNITMIPIRYMCKESTTLMNARVGGVYHKKKVEDVIRDIYKKSKCELPLKLETLNNTTKYDCIMVPEGSFIESMRYLNQQYGLYDNLFLMFGKTFIDSSPQWIINNCNKINHEDIELYFTPHEQSGKESKSIDNKKYYTYLPINIRNTFTQVIHKVPKMIKLVAFDNNKFIKRKDIPFAKTLKNLSFLESNKQFDKLMEVKEQMFSCGRFDMKDYTIKDSIQKIGMNTLDIPDIIIPNPFLLKHFSIGNTIKFISQTQGFMDSDIKLVILGWLLRIKQGTSLGGGAKWNTTLKVRTCATSYLGND